jgi:hypothetical protein
MPVFLDLATTQSLYRYRRNEAEGWRTYDRMWLTATSGSALFARRLDEMVNLGLLNNSDILVVGAGFGFLIEQGMADARLDTVTWYGLEPGPYFWDAAQDGEWDAAVKARVANDYLQSPTVVSSLQGLGASGQARMDFIVDEDCITMHSDAETTEFLDACEDRLQGGAVGRIIHVVTTLGSNGPGHSSVNWKSLQEWHDLRPTHTWVESQTGTAMRNNTVL